MMNGDRLVANDFHEMTGKWQSVTLLRLYETVTNAEILLFSLHLRHFRIFCR
jgi:hypothetical protein